MIEYLGLWVLLALALNMWVLLTVLQAPARLVTKALWTVVLLVPVLGLLVWYFFGPRAKAA